MKHKLTNGTKVDNVVQPAIQSSINLGEMLTEIADTLSASQTNVPSEDEILSHAFLTIEEVAQLLRVSKRTVYNLIYKGTLRATRVSYHVSVIPKSDFLNMLERNSYSKTASVFPKRHNRKTNKPKTEAENTPIESQEVPNGENMVTAQTNTKSKQTSVQPLKP